MSPLIFVGIDASLTRLDMTIRPGASSLPKHDESAIARVVEQLRALSPTLIVLEATGGWKSRSRVRSPRLAGRWLSSIPVRCATLPKPWAVGEDRCPRRAGARTVRRGHRSQLRRLPDTETGPSPLC
jgi:hypothetical protein